MKNKGITLVALVVTIVIMLILASVTLNIVLGDNGLIKQAQMAKEKTDEAVKNEISSMGELEDILHETQTGIKVDKVTDENPGKLEESEDGNTYTIGSIEDLVVFAHNVTSGENNYKDKTVKLGLSLDFASTKSYVDANRTDYEEYGYDGELKKLLNESGFIPIGTKEKLAEEEASKKHFNGTFDGNGNAIYNLRLKEVTSDQKNSIGTGLFMYNYGTIQDLSVENANVYINMNFDILDIWPSVGILAGSNCKRWKD